MSQPGRLQKLAAQAQNQTSITSLKQVKLAQIRETHCMMLLHVRHIIRQFRAKLDTACLFDIRLDLTPLGQAKQFIETSV